jgi:hypothetical protein
MQNSRLRDPSGRSAAWLARLVRDQEAVGSNPIAPTTSSPAWFFRYTAVGDLVRGRVFIFSNIDVHPLDSSFDLVANLVGHGALGTKTLFACICKPASLSTQGSPWRRDSCTYARIFDLANERVNGLLPNPFFAC